MEIVKDKTKINEFVLDKTKVKVAPNIPARILNYALGILTFKI